MLRPWYTVVTPREDLREGKPLDAAEFAVHLDQVRDKRAPADYQEPARFFERTYLTQSLTALASQVVRRLSGEKTETSAVFNMATQFGGGKTHALTLLYHLACGGAAADRWAGVSHVLEQAGVHSVPHAAVAVFVGTEFDSISGRGGDDGTPLRRTPWGEIAFQLGGADALAVLAEHERQMIAPAGDVIRQFLPADKPALILIDELMNYISRNRRSGLATQMYNFLQNLSEEARGRDNLVLAVSIPASELEMSPEDQSDHERVKKMLDRLGKAVMVSAEAETSEIIRRRLFEWDPKAVRADGRVLLNQDARQTCAEYAGWVVEHRQQIPAWFPVDDAQATFEATYPFHPMVMSVFERKWRALPRFQQTRGVLRLLALWVSKAYCEGYKGAHRDPLIGTGTAPLDDPFFRAALLEQLGEPKIEVAITTDICGKKDAHAVRLDDEAAETIRKARLHRKVATAIFFESNGGQLRDEATVPEIRLAVQESGLDIGNVETTLEALTAASYYLRTDRNRYRYTPLVTINKVFADRRASIAPAKIEERALAEVQKAFSAGAGLERVHFPDRSGLIPDRAVLTLVVLSPDHCRRDKTTLDLVETWTREYGASSRTFKSALLWAVCDDDAPLKEEARKALAWEDIAGEAGDLNLDEAQSRQLTENVKKAQRDLREAVWRAYKNIALLGKDNAIRWVDLGLLHSSSDTSLVALIAHRLHQDGDIEDAISPNFLVRNWPPAFREWATKSVRDAFFASPQFPRLLSPDVIRDTIARGVSEGILAYVGLTPAGEYEPCLCRQPLNSLDVEIAADVYIIKGEVAERYLAARAAPPIDETEKPAPAPQPEIGPMPRPQPDTKPGAGFQPPLHAPSVARLSWQGEIPPQKWTNFYMKVLSRFAAGKGMKLILNLEIAPEGGVSAQSIEDMRIALRELGLDDDEVATS